MCRCRPLAAILVGSVFLQAHARSIGIPIIALGLISFGLHLVRMWGSYNSEKAVKIFETLGARVLGPEEAREKLGLKKQC